MPSDCPVFDVDPFSRELLTDPYPFHQAMREAGPVVRLSRYGIWAMARHQEVDASLRDWETFCSGAGVGLSDFRKEAPWRPPSLILEADPPLHTRSRGVLARVLSPQAIQGLREGFAAEAVRLVDRLVARREFDVVTDLAQAYPLTVFPDAVGLGPDGREHLLTYGNMAFNAFGPRNERFHEAMAHAEPITRWILANCRREALAPDGLGARIYAACDNGTVTEEEAGLLVRSFLTAGIDTTVNGIGNALVGFLRHPEEWQRLTANPGLARMAFEEGLRYESPIQTFFRTTTRPVEVGGTRIGEGEKVLLFLGAANRDPRRWENPNRFDIGRRSAGHVAMGMGIHGCVGQMIARLEGELVLAALARRVRTITLTGEPRPRLNNSLRGWDSLPVAVEPR